MSSTSIYGCSTATGNDQKFHYVYRITNLIENKHYYGSRTCTIDPYDDIGKKYFTSSKLVKPLLKESPEKFKIKIIGCYSDRKEALIIEVKLHNKFNVGVNNYFYNKAKQTSCGFDASGMISALDNNGVRHWISTNDVRLKNGELTIMTNGKVVVKDLDGNISLVDKNNKKYINGELVSVARGKAVVKDKLGRTMAVCVDDARFINGDLVGVTKGKFPVRDKNDNVFMAAADDSRLLSGELNALSKGKILAKNLKGEIFSVTKEEFSSNKDDLVGITKGNVALKDKNGKIVYTTKDDPRIKSGELVGTTKGFMWITNGVINKSVPTNSTIPTGWKRGMVKKIYTNKKRVTDK